jgi:hypothetical protein
MRSSGRLFVAFVLVLTLGACGAGRNFTMPADGALQLGVTTPQQAVATLGEPMSKSSATIGSVEPAPGPTSVFTAVKEPGTYDNLVYIYVDTVGQQLIGKLAGIRRARILRLTFWNGTLASYVALSSFQNDSTNFDDGKVSQIERNKTRRSDVQLLLGPPSGGAIYPVISAREGHAILYGYSEDDLQANQRRAKFLGVYVDGTDTVRDFEASSSTNPLPPQQPAGGGTFVVPIVVPHGR